MEIRLCKRDARHFWVAVWFVSPALDSALCNVQGSLHVRWWEVTLTAIHSLSGFVLWATWACTCRAQYQSSCACTAGETGHITLLCTVSSMISHRLNSGLKQNIKSREHFFFKSLLSVLNTDFILDKTYFEKAIVTLKVYQFQYILGFTSKQEATLKIK